jgi:hypothetical protein
MNSKRWLSLAVISCLVLLSSTSLFGQATANASLQGTVMDKSQAVIGNKAESYNHAKGNRGYPYHQDQ